MKAYQPNDRSFDNTVSYGIKKELLFSNHPTQE